MDRCERKKIPFPSEELAWDYAAHVARCTRLRKGGGKKGRIVVFWCIHCRAYHFGHRRKGVVRRARQYPDAPGRE
jgi:hypothetical protein